MKSARWIAALALFAAPGLAYALGIADINTMLDAKKPAAEIVTAVNASTDAWAPKDVYALVDRKAPVDVIKAVAAKAAVFYDGTNLLSLDEQFKKAAAAVPPTHIPIKADADFAQLFAFYDTIAKDGGAIRAKEGARPSAPNPGEVAASFDKRVRAYDEKLVADLAPSDGRIDATIFDVELKFTPGKFDGACWAPATYVVDLSSVPFVSWKNAMGGATKTTYLATLDRKANLSEVKFSSEGQQRFEFTTTKLCPYEYAGELGGHAKLKIELKRSHRGEDWVAKGNVVDGSGSKVDPG